MLLGIWRFSPFLTIHSLQTGAPSGSVVTKIKVPDGHCEQFEQKCQVSPKFVFLYSEMASGDEGEPLSIIAIIRSRPWNCPSHQVWHFKSAVSKIEQPLV